MTVEIFYHHKRVAAHPRSWARGHHIYIYGMGREPGGQPPAVARGERENLRKTARNRIWKMAVVP
jgi:hypothetical protein